MSGFQRFLQPTTAWDWMLYVIAVLALITLLLQGKKGSLTMTILLSAVILCALIDKVNLVNQQVYRKTTFGAYIVHIIMFVSPTVVAGMTKAPKSRGWAIMTAFMGAVYLFAFWFIEQRVV